MTRVLAFRRPSQAECAARIIAPALGVPVQRFQGPCDRAVAFHQPAGLSIPDVRAILRDYPYLEVVADLVTA